MADSAGSRGQTDVDRLLYFIAGIVVLLAVVPAAFGAAGVDVRNGTLLAGAESESDTDGVRILSALGTDFAEDRSSLGVVEVVVTTRGDSTVDLSEATVSWEGNGQYELTPRDVDVGKGSFAIDGEAVLGERTDRAILRFDLGTDDLSTVGRFGERLEPGDTVRLSVVTAEGTRTSERLGVPQPLPSGAGVSL